MDIQNIISSGIIEAYVLGIASDAEVRELELLSAQYPEIAEAIADAQQSMEDYTMEYSIAPPPDLKEKIWSALAAETAPQSVPEAAEIRTLRPEAEHTFKRERSNVPMAAAVALLIGSIVLNFIFWSRSEKANQQLAVVKDNQEKMIATAQQYEQQLAQSHKTMQMVMDPAMKPVALAGVGTHAANLAMVYWDTRSKEVYLAFKNMPPPPSGKQYQLWAIVNGKPVDAGVFALDQKDLMQKMKVIPQAEMFAITLEKEGGSEAPTLEEMYVAGKV